MAAVSGAAGLKPALAAVDRGATVALANKECLVCAGDFFMQRAAKAGACILPADSEHNALFQALAPAIAKNWSASSLPRRVGRFAPGPRRHRAGDAGAGAETSELEHGPEDHHRFGLDDEQGARGDRGRLSVRAGARGDRRSGPSAIDHPRHGRVFRSLRGGATRRARHAHADRALPGLAGSDRRAGGASSILPRSAN